MAAIDSVLQVYDAAKALLRQANIDHFLEPAEHVVEVERLRQLYRPRRDVRLLILAESHVRVTENSFRRNGPAFLYNERYYTPWWQHLLLPAFAPHIRKTDHALRKDLLEKLSSLGVWITDASLISLSGYRKVKAGWPNRPLDALRDEVLELSWRGHVGAQFSRVLNQSRVPAICVLRSVRGVLPSAENFHCTVLNFRCPSNSKLYAQPDYDFGTNAFLHALRQAGIVSLEPSTAALLEQTT